MRQVTIVIEDDGIGTTHVKVYETGNGAGETEKERATAMKIVTSLVEHLDNWGNLLVKAFTGPAAGIPPEPEELEEPIDPEIWRSFKDL